MRGLRKIFAGLSFQVPPLSSDINSSLVFYLLCLFLLSSFFSLVLISFFILFSHISFNLLAQAGGHVDKRVGNRRAGGRVGGRCAGEPEGRRAAGAQVDAQAGTTRSPPGFGVDAGRLVGGEVGSIW
jgi:hypothetical protein